jgi:Kelch motif/Galactose oxidase, central domain
MKRVLVCSAIVALCTATGGAARAPFPGTASWADARHGWAPNPGYEGLCRRAWRATGDSSLCSTDNGGRTWRMIFAGGNYVFAAVRTSAQAGIVSTGAYGHFEYWTRDNGKHWYPALLPGIDSSSLSQPWFVGRGDQVFYARELGDTIYQLTPWPPTELPPCTGWSRSVLSDDADPAGNVCLVEPGQGAVNVVPALTVAGGLVDWARAPGGLVAVFRRDDQTRLTVAVRQAGVNTIRDLPAPDLPAGTSGTVRKLRIDWPSITVVGLYLTGPESRESHEVVWRSTDAGATWSVERRAGWTRGPESPLPQTGAAAGVVDEEIILAGGRAGVPGAQPDRRASSAVQAYRPSDGSWRRLPDLPTAVTRAAGAATGAELYVVGGFGRNGAPLRDAFVLRAGRWNRLPSAPEPRAAAGAAILGGKLYVVGGIGRVGLAGSTLVLDLKSNRWSRAPGPRRRAYLAVVAARGRIVALGGRVAGAETGMALVESWRPGERRWRRLPSLPSGRSDAAAVAFDGRIIVLGGAATDYYQPLGSAVALELPSGRWEPLPDLTAPRHGLAAAEVAGTIYALVGGDDYGQDDLSPVNESLRLS